MVNQYISHYRTDKDLAITNYLDVTTMTRIIKPTVQTSRKLNTTPTKMEQKLGCRTNEKCKASGLKVGK